MRYANLGGVCAMENGSYVYDKSRDNGLRYLSGEAFRRSKELAIAKELGVILENPDKTESFELYNSGESERMLALVGEEFGIGVMQTPGKPKEVTAKLFNPHEVTQDSYRETPLDVHTSVVAFDGYIEDGDPSGEKAALLFFKLSANVPGEPTPPMTMEDFSRKTSTYGAVVSGNGIEYFEFIKCCDIKRVSSINSPLDTSLEKKELKEELEKFIKSR